MRHAARTKVAVLIPAHDEADHIADAIASVPHCRVIVIADNCTDDTAQIAHDAGAEVLVTAGNTHKKAGALNQALAWLLPHWDGHIMVMDADSFVGPKFVYIGVNRLDADPELGAVGGVFYAHQPEGLVERFQANEYRRYSRVIAQRNDRVQVLSGTASMFRAAALRDLLATRGYVYDWSALTEDNEMTLALKSRGWGLVSPQKCTVHTAVMQGWGDLINQRLRWYRGALDNLLSYGWTPVTRRYWLQQAGLAASMIATVLYLTLMIWATATDRLGFSLFWAAIGAGFVVERVVTVWRQGVAARVLAALLIPEMIYDIVLQYIFLRAAWSVITRREVHWVHPSTAKV